MLVIYHAIHNEKKYVIICVEKFELKREIINHIIQDQAN